MPVLTGHRAVGNLPADLTSFVGRRRELVEVKSALSDGRLVTLTGPGGVGKTRLALHVAGDLRRSVRHGAWFIELADLRDPALLVKVVAAELGIRDQSNRWPLSLLVDYLQDKDILLVLDNCEYLLDACSVAAQAILQAAPGVRILATSRQPLGVTAERVFPVPSLAVPEPEGRLTLERLAQFEAIALFSERVGAATGRFALTLENQHTVVELCRRLDGVPLALELAAVRARSLGLDEILARLNDRFSLLTGGSRGARPRQQTLQAAIDWSHDLLSQPEQTLLRRLAVFAGGFDLEAVEAVASGGVVSKATVLDLMSSLVEKSLVNREGTASRARYRLHETMREYALTRLGEAADELDTIRSAHLRWYRDLAERFEADSFGPRLPQWFDRLDEEAGNIRVALQYCLESPAHLDSGLELAGMLWVWWETRALSEAVGIIQSLLRSGPAKDHPRARALRVLGGIALSLNDLPLAETSQAQALPLARKVKDSHLVSLVLASQAMRLMLAREDFAESGRLLEEARGLAAAIGDPQALSNAEGLAGFRAIQLGEHREATKHLAAANDVCRRHGDSYLLSQHLFLVGLGAIERGAGAEAESAFKESLRLKRRLDDRGAAAIFSLDGLANCALRSGDAKKAARLQGAAAAMRRRQGFEIHTVLANFVSTTTAGTKGVLGENGYATEHGTGARMEYDEAVAYALDEAAEHSRPSETTEIMGVHLSKREEEVGKLVADGLSNKQIGARLFLSERTIETHVSNLLNKLGVNARAQIAAWFATKARVS